MRYVYLVLDLENNGMLCRSITPTTANAVSLGFMNSTPMVLVELPWGKKVSEINSDDNLIIQSGGTPVPMPLALITEEWKAKKALAAVRNNLQLAWEMRCVQQLQRRASDFHSSGVFEAYALDQLRQCDPEQKKWSLGVLEWASIQGMEVEAGYHDLKMRVDGTGLLHLRNAALYQRVVRDINRETTEKKMTEAFRLGMESMFKGKSLI